MVWTDEDRFLLGPRTWQGWFNIDDAEHHEFAIGPLNVSEDVRVLSFEATEDLIAGAEGIPNPHRPNWTTICQDGAKLANGVVRPEMTPSTAHNANRYGAMAAKKPSISSAGALNVELIESGWGLKPW